MDFFEVMVGVKGALVCFAFKFFFKFGLFGMNNLAKLWRNRALVENQGPNFRLTLLPLSAGCHAVPYNYRSGSRFHFIYFFNMYPMFISNIKVFIANITCGTDFPLKCHH